MIIDGEELKADPVSVMNKLQLFLKIEPLFDYKQHLRFDPKKGFFCQVTNLNSTKCLGKSKGRVYPPMESRAQKFLRSFYLSHNIALSKLLTKLHHVIPSWLEDDLSTGYS
jgi:heparan sulfate N-deacetylase/N-sulfotransferase NDST2